MKFRLLTAALFAATALLVLPQVPSAQPQDPTAQTKTKAKPKKKKAKANPDAPKKQTKRSTCEFGADDQKLQGAERKKFMSRCMASSDTPKRKKKAAPKQDAAPQAPPNAAPKQ